MTADALITKYRPRSFKEVIGQDKTVDSLYNTIERNLAHSFLFIGPSGCGKTTLARLVANAFEIEESSIREINAAKYTGVDDMREITDSIIYRGFGVAGKKAYIIDECHMLSKSAWNSLLKSVEEPPEWVYWFFCTTDFARCPKTLETRCSTYRVNLVPARDIEDLLFTVCDEEKMEVAQGVVEACAKAAEGSPRQALSNLAKCAVARDRKEALELLARGDEKEEAVELARCLFKDTTWRRYAELLTALKETDAESVRRVVRSYATSVALGARDVREAGRALDILAAFEKPMYNEGIDPLVLAVGNLAGSK